MLPAIAALITVAADKPPERPVAGADAASAVIEKSGVRSGLAVELGFADGEFLAALGARPGFLAQGLHTDTERVEEVRAYVRGKGVYGRASVNLFDGKRLPYVDNLVDLLVVSDAESTVPAEEIRRVLAPLGVVCRRRGSSWETTGKPWPETIDEWPQYLRGADNNAVAQDTVVGPPRYQQWVDEPTWMRSHMTLPSIVCMVSARGRLFSIEDRASIEHPVLPGRFVLVARGAFNGVGLWQHRFPDWEPITVYVKCMPMQLQRRLAAIGDVVYCTPGLSAPITAFDAATGKVLRTYDGTEKTQEFAYDDGLLFAVVGDPMPAGGHYVKFDASVRRGGADPGGPFDGTGFRGAYAPDFRSSRKKRYSCAILALDADSGRTLWQSAPIIKWTGCSLSVRGSHLAYQTADGLVCLDAKTGKRRWSVDQAVRTSSGIDANTVVLSDRTVYAQEGTTLAAYDLADGARKWEVPVVNNYRKPADVFLIGDRVWTCGDGEKPHSFDAVTGQVRERIDHRTPSMSIGHDRCYRNFITERFYITSRTGGADFFALDGKAEFPHVWTRGACGSGVLPCNGLLYAPPFSCACSPGLLVNNFNAYTTEPDLQSSEQPIPVEQDLRLIRGPAYGATPRPEKTAVWPTYRHDASRSGVTDALVPAHLAPCWQAKLVTQPSAPVIAEDMVLTAAVDVHTVTALNAADGKVLWEYMTGARVDSPPTWRGGLLYFGSRDGWVHCLRAADGALVWRFKDLPDRIIGAFGQLESAWPVSGSVLIQNDKVYFTAGRSSFLDGGIFVYALDPGSGRVLHRRQMYGPFDPETGFPGLRRSGGFKADICVGQGDFVYVRHQGFKADLTDVRSTGPHVTPSPGFLDSTPQHRTFWTLGGYLSKQANPLSARPTGDILVTDGTTYYEVRGYPVARHSYFDPRVKGYTLFAGPAVAPTGGRGKKRAKKKAKGGTLPVQPTGKWSLDIPLTGRALIATRDTIFVAGTPAHLPPDHGFKRYADAYDGKLGGLLWAVGREDGKRLAEYKLEAAPRWDGMAAAEGKLIICLENGTVLAWETARD